MHQGETGRVLESNRCRSGMSLKCAHVKSIILNQLKLILATAGTGNKEIPKSRLAEI